MPVKQKPKARAAQSGSLPMILIILGIGILVTAVFLLKNKPEPSPDMVGQAPEAQLDWYLENKQPVFVFFHSSTCQTCINMMAVVDQVYPEYKDQIALVDVDVYAPVNEPLLRRARITNIPTQMFINHLGEGKTTIGGMQPEELHMELQALTAGAARGD